MGVESNSRIGRRSVLLWILALAISAAIILPATLDPRHAYKHHAIDVVLAASTIIIGIAALLRFAFFAAGWLGHHYAPNQTDTPPSATPPSFCIVEGKQPRRSSWQAPSLR
jgi:hypothetical protein